MTAVTLTSLTRRYGAVTALDDVDLELPSGRVTALLGPSGCGKTTTLKVIGGLLPPSSGTVRFDGVDQADVRAERRGAVMVFQDHLLFPYLSVADNVGFGLRMRGVAGRRRRALAEEMLDRVGLPGTADRSPQELSGGQRQRVALARALVVEPRVLLLDEPLASLDPHLRDGMRELILDVQRDLEVTTVVVTHDQEEAAVLADRIAVMFDGRVAQVGTARELHDRPSDETVARFLGSPNLVPGVRSGGHVATAAGDLEVPHGVTRDGPVLLTIRPEAIVVAPSSGPNILAGRVRDARDLGARVQITVEVEGVTLTLVTRPDALRALLPGADVHLRLPAEALWAMPAADGPGSRAVDDLPGAATRVGPPDLPAGALGRGHER